MRKFLSIRLLAFGFLSFIIFSFTSSTAAAGGWQATYWNNTDLSGDPVLQIFETDQNLNPELDRNWGNWRPWPQVEKDFFSARWERTVNLQPGRYRFSATADDGVRVWVNGQLIIDEWFNQVVAAHRGYYDVTAQSDVAIKVEYYEYQHDAIAKLTWDRVYGSDSALTGQIYEPAITAWRGEYYNNRVVAGIPNLVRDDADINFNWGLDSPAIEAINAEGFSVRWTRNINLPAGLYRFTASTDDGVRLYINNRLVIDQWTNQTIRPHSADVNHTGGVVAIKMEYYDALGLAEAHLNWEQIGPAAPVAGGPVTLGNWRAEYYANSVLAASPALVRYDNDINFDWGLESPIPSFPGAELVQDGFSVRWTGNLNLPAGQYQFITSTDDGVRLWINNQLVIDKWRKQAELAFNVTVDLPGGTIPVKMEYFNVEHIARAKLMWTRLDGPLPEDRGLVPPVVPAAGSGSGNGGTAAAPIALPPIDIPAGTPVITVTQPTLNARAAGNILSDKVGTVRQGDELPVLGRNEFNTWLQVVLPSNQLGWVSVLYVEIPFDVSELEVVNNPTMAVDVDASGNITPTATINSALNQVRNGPHMMAQRIGTLPRNTTVTVIGRSQFSTWLLVDLPSGGTGWVSVLYAETNVPVASLSVVEN